MKATIAVIAVLMAVSVHADESDSTDHVKCLADNIYFEARNQGTAGKIGVGHVTLNRIGVKPYPDSICGVVWYQVKDKKTGKVVPHFSWTLDGKPDRPPNHEQELAAYKKARALAELIISGETIDITDGATHFHAVYVQPYWAPKMTQTVQINDHIFYR